MDYLTEQKKTFSKTNLFEALDLIVLAQTTKVMLFFFQAQVSRLPVVRIVVKLAVQLYSSGKGRSVIFLMAHFSMFFVDIAQEDTVGRSISDCL